MKYKHINKGIFPIGLFDSKSNYFPLKPGESCILDVKRINSDLKVEEITEKINTKKTNKTKTEDD